MTNPTTTDNKSLDLVRRLDAFVWDNDNFDQDGLMIFARNVMGDIHRAFRDQDENARRLVSLSAELHDNIRAGRGTQFDVDRIAQTSRDLADSQSRFDSNLHTLRALLSSLATDDDSKAIVRSLFYIR